MDATVTTLISDQFADVTSLVTTVLGPAAFGLTLLGVGIAAGIRAVRKHGTRAAAG